MFNEATSSNKSDVYGSLIEIVDFLILKRADLVVCSHLSNFTRLIYESMHMHDPDPFYKFITLGKDYHNAD